MVAYYYREGRTFGNTEYILKLRGGLAENSSNGITSVEVKLDRGLRRKRRESVLLLFQEIWLSKKERKKSGYQEEEREL